VLLTLALLACDTAPLRPIKDLPAAEPSDGDGGGSLGGDRPPGDSDAPAVDSGDDGGDGGDGGGGGDSAAPQDAAAIEAADFPSALTCGEARAASLTLRNSGDTTWSRDAGYKLGAVDDSDPFFDGTRVYLDEGQAVAPWQSVVFEIPLAAPEHAGAYETDWRMVLEGVHWFGDTASATVEVDCAVDDPPPLDLGAVTWLHTDVSGWPVTSTLDPIYFSGDSICLDYDRADDWPADTPLDEDTEVVGNPWVFIWWDDRWYGGTWEWLRPGQTCKAQTSVAGDHIKVSPFDEDSGWRPTSGVTYYFMVSGLARTSHRNVEERTEPVPFIWP